MVSRALTLATLVAAVQLTGCSVFRSYDSELQETNKQLAAGNVDAALALLDPHAGAAAVDVAVVARTPREKHDFQYNWSSPHESLPKNS